MCRSACNRRRWPPEYGVCVLDRLVPALRGRVLVPGVPHLRGAPLEVAIQVGTIHAVLDPESPEFLRKHVGHEMKHLAFAVAQFSNPDANEFRVALQDSALVRGRTLLYFFDRRADRRSVSIHNYLDPSKAGPPKIRLAQRWIDFISGRLSHIGRNRESSDDIDQWPDREPGQEPGEDRLERLVRLVIDVMRSRIPYLREECLPVLEQIVQRAEAYLTDPTEARYHAMDPANFA
jgi:hypothetical protein